MDDQAAMQAKKLTPEDLAVLGKLQALATGDRPQSGLLQNPEQNSNLVPNTRNLGSSQTDNLGFTSDLPQTQAVPQMQTAAELQSQAFAKGGVVQQMNGMKRDAEPAKPKDIDMTHEKKLKAIYKAMGMTAMDDGGVVTPVSGPMQGPPPPPAPSDPGYMTWIKNALAAVEQGGKSALNGIMAPANAIAPSAAAIGTAGAPALTQGLNAVSQQANSALGTSIPSLNMPQAPIDNALGSDANPIDADKTLGITNAPPLHPAMSMGAPAPVQAPASNPIDQLGKFDPSTIAPGMNAGDRTALGNQLQTNSHSFGNLLAEALGGLGDAVAARGGAQQNSLGRIMALQKSQRDEALDNFDKARQIAMQNFSAKNSADQDLINNLKAKGELQVSPGIAKAIGHPELAGKPVQQADLVIKADQMNYEFANHMQERKQAALKDAADEVEKANAHGGILGTQKMQDPQSQLQMIHTQAIKNDPEAFGYSVTQGQ